MLLEEYSLSDIAATFLESTGHSLSSAVGLFSVTWIFSLIFIAAFIYMVYSVGHLAKKHRTLIQFIVAVVGLSIVNTVQTQFTAGLLIQDISKMDSFGDFWQTMISAFHISVGCDILFTAVFAGITYLILRYKVNLE